MILYIYIMYTLFAPYSHPIRALCAYYAHTNMRSILSIIEMSDNIKK